MKRCQRILVTALIVLNLFQAGGFVWLYVQYTRLNLYGLVDRIYAFLNTTDTAIFNIQTMLEQEIARLNDSIRAMQDLPKNPSSVNDWLHTPP